MSVALTARAPRFVNPNAPLEEQARVLREIITNPPENSRAIVITPDLARWALENTPRYNRKLRGDKIARFARDMLNGDWRYTGDTIKFSRVGHLLDGYHRLTACVRAKVSFKTDVKFGVDEEVFTKLDVGTRRTPSDAFAVEGVPAAREAAGACRWLKILTSDNPRSRETFENEATLKIYREFSSSERQLFDDSVKKARVIRENCPKIFAETQLAALLFLFHKNDKAACKKFIEDLCDIRRRTVGAQLVRYIRGLRATGRLFEDVHNACIIRAWVIHRRQPMNAAYKGGESALRWSRNESFPEII